MSVTPKKELRGRTPAAGKNRKIPQPREIKRKKRESPFVGQTRQPRETKRKKRESPSQRRRRLEKEVFSIELGAFLNACEAANTPRSLACYLLASNGEWDQYLELPFPDQTANTFPIDYGVTEMLRKCPRLPIQVDREEKALQKWVEAENRCAATNQRIRDREPGLLTLISKMRKKIRSILGRLSHRDVEFAEAHFRFGPGSTLSVSGREVLLSQKMTENPYSATTRLWPLIPFYSNAVNSPVSQLTDLNRMVFVPKNALIDRVIAIEPHWNIFVQLGFGALIRAKLANFGLNCNTQEINQRAALLAHKLGLATLDLKSASDTIAFLLVKELLDEEWFSLLNVARTPQTCLPDGTLVHLEKFSSMGNGYTWELETLVFYALLLVVAEDMGIEDTSNLLAYGDDLIVPQEMVVRVIEGLESLGFQVNERKSFWQGDFFESCGLDSWRGQNIRPYYFKGTYEDIHTAVIRMANGIRRYASRLGHGIYCDRRLLSAHRFITHHSRLARDTCIPEGYGDAGLIKDWGEANSRTRSAGSRLRTRGWEGFIASTLERRPKQSGRTCIRGALNIWYLRGLQKSLLDQLRGAPRVDYMHMSYRALAADKLLRDTALEFREASLEVSVEYARGETKRDRKSVV